MYLLKSDEHPGLPLRRPLEKQIGGTKGKMRVGGNDEGRKEEKEDCLYKRLGQDVA